MESSRTCLSQSGKIKLEPIQTDCSGIYRRLQLFLLRTRVSFGSVREWALRRRFLTSQPLHILLPPALLSLRAPPLHFQSQSAVLSAVHPPTPPTSERPDTVCSSVRPLLPPPLHIPTPSALLCPSPPLPQVLTPSAVMCRPPPAPNLWTSRHHLQFRTPTPFPCYPHLCARVSLLPPGPPSALEQRPREGVPRSPPCATPALYGNPGRDAPTKAGVGVGRDGDGRGGQQRCQLRDFVWVFQTPLAFHSWFWERASSSEALGSGTGVGVEMVGLLAFGTSDPHIHRRPALGISGCPGSAPRRPHCIYRAVVCSLRLLPASLASPLLEWET